MSIEDEVYERLWSDPNEVCRLAAHALWEMAESDEADDFCFALQSCYEKDDHFLFDAYTNLNARIIRVLGEYLVNEADKECRKSDAELQHDYDEAMGYDRD